MYLHTCTLREWTETSIQIPRLAYACIHVQILAYIYRERDQNTLFIHICTQKTYTYTLFIYSRNYACKHTYTYGNIHTHMHIMRTGGLVEGNNIFPRKYIHTHTLYIHTYTHTNTCMHTYTHTHKHAVWLREITFFLANKETYMCIYTDIYAY
jgi:hypothetical protein